MKACAIAIFLACCGCVMAADTAVDAPVDGKEAKLVLNSRSFVFVGKVVGNAVSTYRYVPEGSTAEDWTEMVTHQVVRLQSRASADEVLGFLKGKTSGGVRMEPILETRKAAVFASLAPKTESTESQLGVGFVFLDLINPFEAHIISFTLKPNRLSQPDVEASLRSWRDLFKARATALASSS